MPFTFPSDSTGKAGAIKITPGGDDFYVPVITGGHARAPFSGSTSITRSFTSPMQGLVISNDGTADLTFTIGSDAYTVKAGEVFEATFDPFTQVSINANVPYRGYVLGYSGSGQQTTDTIPPVNVPSVTTSGLSQTGVTLTWQASTSNDTTGYDIYNGSTFLASVAGLTYAVTGLTAGTQYTFWVKAKDLAGNVASGTNVSVTTATGGGTPGTPDTTPPLDVTLSTSNVTSNGVRLTWTANTAPDFKDYLVYSGTTLLATMATTLYDVAGLTANTSYTFKVTSRDTANNESAGATATITTSATADTTPPTDVTTLTASAITQTGCTLTWNASGSSDTKDYQVYNGAALLATVTTLTYNVTGLSAGTLYTFKVVVRDTSNNVSTPGKTADVTTVAPDTTAPAPVTQLATGTISSNSIAVTWTKPSDPDLSKYEVAHSTDGTNFTVANAAVAGTAQSYTVTGLTTGTLYTIRVVAIDTASNRSTPATVQGTTAASGAAPGAVIFEDTFNRANVSILDNGWKGDSGGNANLGIDTNEVRNYGSTNGQNPSINFVAWQETSTSDNISVSVDMVVSPGNGTGAPNGVVLRYVDQNNYWVFCREQAPYNGTNGWTVERRIAGVTKQFPVFTPTETFPTTVKAELRGDMIHCYAFNTLMFTLKDSTHQTATKHGISAGNSTTSRFDNFKVQDISNVPAPAADTTAPAAPGGLIANNQQTTQFNFYWNKVADIDTYWYVISKDGALFAENAFDNAKAATQLSRNITGLSSGTNYTVGIKAMDGSGNASTETTITTRTSPAPVTNLTATNITATSLTLTWNASATTTATQHRVFNGTTRLTNPDITALTYSVTGLTASTSYTFKVTVYDTVNVPNLGYTIGSDSNTVTVSTTA